MSFKTSVFRALAVLSIGLSRASAAGLYTEGHGDIRAVYEQGEFTVRYQLDGNAIVDGELVDPVTESIPATYELSELVTWIPDLPLALPEGLEGYEFIGVEPGAPLWLIPEVQEFDRPWLGFSTEELQPEDWVDDSIRLALVDVTGPEGAEFSLFQSDPVGQPIVQFATSDGIDEQDVYLLSTRTHAHANWVFTQPGDYAVTVKFSGEHVTDGYQEAIGSVNFAVAVPEPSAEYIALVGAAAIVWAKQKHTYSKLHA